MGLARKEATDSWHICGIGSVAFPDGVSGKKPTDKPVLNVGEISLASALWAAFFPPCGLDNERPARCYITIDTVFTAIEFLQRAVRGGGFLVF